MTTANAGGEMISVFGGSQCRPGDREYEEAREVGRLLAEAGYVVCTGGYQGTIAAVIAKTR